MVKAKQIALECQILSQHQISMRSWISPNYLEKYHTLRDSSVPNTLLLLLLLLLLQNSRGIIDCTTEMQLMYETIIIGEHASSGSSSEVSQSMPLIPRIPPIAYQTPTNICFHSQSETIGQMQTNHVQVCHRHVAFEIRIYGLALNVQHLTFRSSEILINSNFLI
jgi:hypothetical protein